MKYRTAVFFLFCAVSVSFGQLHSHSSKRPGSSPYKPLIAAEIWDEDALQAEGQPRMEIHLDGQVAKFHKGEEFVGQSPISSGMKGHETKPGSYRVVEKKVEHFSNLYGAFVNADGRIVGYGNVDDAPPPGTHYEPSPMPYFLRLTWGGLGLHGGYLPGYPASHGCVRLPGRMAKRFFEALPMDAQVDIWD